MKSIFHKGLSIIALLLSIIMTSERAEASHVMGADITYRCISNLKFEVIVKFYRDCRGVPFGNPSNDTRVRCASGSGSQIVNLSLVTIRDVTPVCASEPSRCNPKNTYGTGEGIEEHTYTGIVDFNVSPYSTIKNSCDQVIFETGQCCRNGAINTGPSGNFFTFAMIDLKKAPCNTSPSLTTEPIGLLCCNQPYYFNNGASDTSNFDSLSYSFTPPLSAYSSQLSYTGTYTYQKPFEVYYPSPLKWPYKNVNADPPIGLDLDPETGDLIFTPTKCDEVTVAALEVKEWRKDSSGKYQLIGITRRDMQFITQTCPGNYPPQITNSTFVYRTCAGEQICFNVTTDDKVFVPPAPLPKPPPDTVRLSWNRGIPGATFRITNKGALNETGQFCWTPGVKDASDLPYTFVAMAKDDACPLNAVTLRSFRVYVKHKAEAARNVDTLPCGYYSVESQPIPSFRGTPQYSWQILDEAKNIVFDRKIAYFKSTGAFLSKRQFDTILFRKGGTYIIQHVINNLPNNCPTTYEDTLIVPPLLQVTLAFGPDTFVCAGTKLRLQPTIAQGSQPLKFQWGTPIIQDPGDTLEYKDIEIPNWQIDSSFSVIITDKYKCQSWDTVKVWLKPNPYVNIGPDLRICTYDSITINPNDSLAYWDDPRDTSEFKIRQGDTLWMEWGLNGKFLQSDRILKTSIKGMYTLKVIDSLGCSYIDTMNLFVNDTVRTYAGPDQTKCWGDTLTLIASGYDSSASYKRGEYRWWDYTTIPGTRVNKGNKTKISFQTKLTADYQLELFVTEDTTICVHRDSVNVWVNPLPVMVLPEDKSICCDAGSIDLNFMTPLSPSPGSSSKWYSTLTPNAVESGQIFPTGKLCDVIKRNFVLTYQYRNPITTCVGRDSMAILVNPLPKIDLKAGYYCQDAGKVRLQNHLNAPKNPNGGQFNQWKCVDCRGFNEATIIKDESGSAFFTDYYLYVDKVSMPMGGRTGDTITLEFIFRDNAGCWGRDTTSFRIVKVPEITFVGFPELCWDLGEVNLIELSKVDPINGRWKCRDTLVSCFDTSTANRALYGDTLDTRKTNPLGNTYNMRYYHDASGCPVWRDTTLVINPLPIVTLTKLPLLICQTDASITMSALPPGGVWTANKSGSISGNLFTPSTAPTGQQIKIIYTYTHPVTGCIGRDTMSTQVEALPEVEILTKNLDTCRGYDLKTAMTLNVSARMANTTGLEWTTLSQGNNLNTKTGTNVIWSFNPSYDTSETFLLYVQTKPGNACPFVDDLLTLRVHPRPQVTITPDDPNGCNPHNVFITTTFNNKANPATSIYNWSFGDNSTSTIQNPSHTYTTDGTQAVLLKVVTEYGCDSSVGLNVDVYPVPNASFTPNPDNYTTAALPRFKFFNESSVSGVLNSFIQSQAWDFGDQNSDIDTSSKYSPLYYYSGDTARYNVWLKVTTNYGCVDSTMRQVIVGPDVLVFIPNAFTPGDGGPMTDDVFDVVASGFKSYSIIIFDRWGEILFESDDIRIGWNGTYKGVICQQDVYAYHVIVTSMDNKVYKYDGTVTLLR